MFDGELVFQPIWFCLNPIYHLKHSKYITDLPPPPISFPIAIGTNLTNEEVKFLLFASVPISGVQPHPTIPSASIMMPYPFELWIDMISFLKSPNFANPEMHPQSQNKHQYKTRNSLSNTHRKKIADALKLHLKIRSKATVEDRNIWGFRFSTVKPWENIGFRFALFHPARVRTSMVERYNKPYVPCKHILWVFKDVHGLALWASNIILQLVLSISEV